jgi:CRISPR-associated endonuclease/helicase Cas3
LELTATQTGAATGEVFALLPAERDEPIVHQRISAAKVLRVHAVEDAGDLVQKIADAALAHRDARVRVVVYVRSPDAAARVGERLRQALRDDARVALLTGTLRGHERDGLVATPVVVAMRPGEHRAPLDASVFLVSTSAGEVGVNFDADHLVCDLETLDSMVQRLGRVNRFGRADDRFVARVEVFDAPGRSKRRKARDDDEEPGPSMLDRARSATGEALRRLPARQDGVDVSPAALRSILDDSTVVEAAFAPAPRVVPCTDVLLDAWALTSAREPIPGRPLVDPWLHGIESEPPQTVVVWREEVRDLAGLLRQHGRRAAASIEEWFEVHPIEARERLRAPAEDVWRHVEDTASRMVADPDSNLQAIVLPRVGFPRLCDPAGDSGQIGGATLVLTPDAGGLTNGVLDGKAHAPVPDVADASAGDGRERFRVRVSRAVGGSGWTVVLLGRGDESIAARLAGVTLERADHVDAAIASLLLGLSADADPLVERTRVTGGHDDDDAEPAWALVSLGKARRPETALDSSAAARTRQTLDDHLGWAGDAAAVIARRVGLDSAIASAVEVAARWHDRGKARTAWQRAIRNGPPRDPAGRAEWLPLAKTGHGRFDVAACPGYRHEFGSLVDAARDPAIAAHIERDLVLHLIASHHGRARPHFTGDELDPEACDEDNATAAHEAMRRYARLQRRFGRWGLAWLEALLKSADVVATVRGAAVAELPA